MTEIQRLHKIIRLQKKIIKNGENSEELLKKQIKLLQSMVDASRIELIDWGTLERKCLL